MAVVKDFKRVNMMLHPSSGIETISTNIVVDSPEVYEHPSIRGSVRIHDCYHPPVDLHFEFLKGRGTKRDAQQDLLKLNRLISVLVTFRNDMVDTAKKIVPEHELK